MQTRIDVKEHANEAVSVAQTMIYANEHANVHANAHANELMCMLVVVLWCRR